MATREEVRSDMYVRLYIDNFQRVFEAGEAWEEMPMSFYYLEEKQVDIATKQVMITILKREHKTLPDSRWTELRQAINLATSVSSAIDIITVISAFAV